MRLLSSPHVHTNYADGKNTPAEVAEYAFTHGFYSLGFSEHAHEMWPAQCCIQTGKVEEYQSVIRALQREYAGRLPIWLGVERDYFSDAVKAEYDFMIGSVHYLKWRDGVVSTDGKAEPLKQYILEECGGDGLVLAKRYYETLSGYLLDLKPEICGHFDVLTKTSDEGGYFDSDSKAYLDIAFAALDAVKEAGCLLEINTGAMARYGKTMPYPRRPLLERWHEIGGQIILGSDSHQRETLDFGYDVAWEFARSCGYKTAFILGKERLFEEYTI